MFTESQEEKEISEARRIRYERRVFCKTLEESEYYYFNRLHIRTNVKKLPHFNCLCQVGVRLCLKS